MVSWKFGAISNLDLRLLLPILWDLKLCKAPCVYVETNRRSVNAVYLQENWFNYRAKFFSEFILACVLPILEGWEFVKVSQLLKGRDCVDT